MILGIESSCDESAIALFDPNTGTVSSVDTSTLPDIIPITESYTETFEVGWTGFIADRFSIQADVYYMKKNDFVSPLVVETPLLFLDQDDLIAYLTPFLGAQIRVPKKTPPWCQESHLLGGK